METVLSTSQEYIEQGKYAEAEQILRDGTTYEQWMSKFGA